MTTALPAVRMWSRNTVRSPCSAPMRAHMLQGMKARHAARLRAWNGHYCCDALQHPALTLGSCCYYDKNTWHLHSRVQARQVRFLAACQKLPAAVQDGGQVRLQQAAVYYFLQRLAHVQTQVGLAAVKLLTQAAFTMQKVGCQLQFLQNNTEQLWHTRTAQKGGTKVTDSKTLSALQSTASQV